MKYNPPFNSTPTPEVPEPPYVDGNKTAGIKGSTVPAAAVEHPQREILAVIAAAGLSPSPADLTQLLQAIQIIAGGVGAPPASFGLNPVFPEVITNGGVMSITPSTGQVILATGQQWIYRGGTLYNSSDLLLAARTLSTVANKTYHMRWRYNGGAPTLALYDLADVAYNPGVVAETNEQFDTSYDDILIARVITNGANTPTVTALKNLNRLADEQTAGGVATIWSSGTGSDGGRYQNAFTLNWARTPKAVVTGILGQGTTPVLNGFANLVTINSKTRYLVDSKVESDFNANLAGSSPYGSLRMLATA